MWRGRLTARRAVEDGGEEEVEEMLEDEKADEEREEDAGEPNAVPISACVRLGERGEGGVGEARGNMRTWRR